MGLLARKALTVGCLECLQRDRRVLRFTREESFGSFIVPDGRHTPKPSYIGHSGDGGPDED